MALLLTMSQPREVKMESDRELLELAAKAAGIASPDCINDSGFIYYKDRDCEEWTKWNPLTEDGDALRLMVKLNLDVNVGTKCTRIVSKPLETGIKLTIDHFGDAMASTRIGIVRAAAEIGRRMQDEQSTAARG